jgi:hypothetical protein
VSLRRRPTTLVTVISENRETVDGLHGYLTRAGVESRGARLGEASRIPRGTTAVVIFPDDFEPKEVLRAVASLHDALPATLVVLVTARPQPFLTASAVPASASSTLILPKPVFGWAILDAIRSHQDPALA